MDSTTKYVPILKWKQGEQMALATLSSPEKAELLPVVEVIPPLWDTEEDDWKTSPQEHFEAAVQKIGKHWGPERIAVDLRHVDPALRIGGQHPLDVVGAAARAAGLSVVPAINPAQDADYRAAVARMVEEDGLGLLVRVGPEHFLDGGATIPSLVKTLGAPPPSVDLVLDLEALDRITFERATLPGVLRSFPSRDQWLTLTLAGGSFPDSMEHKGEEWFERLEWHLWSHLASEKLPRMPCFGDYGVNDPGFRVIEGVIRGSANLRYTTEEAWFVLRGHSLKKAGHEQFRTMCKDVVARPFYRGASFSWGDGFIDRCAADKEGPGNQSTWRKVATSHHIKFVLHQVASSGAI